MQARAPTEAVIPKYVQPKTILSLDVPSDLKVLSMNNLIPNIKRRFKRNRVLNIG